MDSFHATNLGIIAIHEHNIAYLRRAIDRGADLIRLLEITIEQQDIEMMKEILKHPIDFEDSDFLYRAIRSQNLEMTRLLLNAGADVNSLYEYTTPLHTAVLNTYGLDMVGLLLEYGANSNLLDYDDATPSQLARRLDEHDMAKFIEDYYNEDIKEPVEDYESDY
jgi:ankyrin repeat protein